MLASTVATAWAVRTGTVDFSTTIFPLVTTWTHPPQKKKSLQATGSKPPIPSHRHTQVCLLGYGHPKLPVWVHTTYNNLQLREIYLGDVASGQLTVLDVGRAAGPNAVQLGRGVH